MNDSTLKKQHAECRSKCHVFRNIFIAVSEVMAFARASLTNGGTFSISHYEATKMIPSRQKKTNKNDWVSFEFLMWYGEPFFFFSGIYQIPLSYPPIPSSECNIPFVQSMFSYCQSLVHFFSFMAWHGTHLHSGSATFLAILLPCH